MGRPDVSLARCVLPCLALGAFLSACADGGTTGPDPDSEPEEPDSNQAPTAEITSPTDGAEFKKGETVTFEGSADDPEDGGLTGESLAWESDLDGRLGTGTSVETADLSVGEHTVALTATDSRGATGSDEIGIEVRKSPKVELSANLPRPDLSFSEAVNIANGEAVVLAWSTEGSPGQCRASGAWSSEKSTAGDTTTTEGLAGPAELEYILTCENSVGADTDTAFVDVAAPGERHATSNRPDETTKPLVKIFYVIPKDVEDRELDLSRFIDNEFQKFQRRFDDVKGTRFRVDSYEEGYDIAFVRLDSTKVEFEGNLGNFDQIVRGELEERGFDESRTDKAVYLFLYDNGGDTPAQACGNGGFGLATVWSKPCMENHAVAGHEIVHALGMVDNDAPNHERGNHVTGPDDDLMNSAVVEDFRIDPGCDDYFCKAGLPSDIKNLAESPFLVGI